MVDMNVPPGVDGEKEKRSNTWQETKRDKQIVRIVESSETLWQVTHSSRSASVFIPDIILLYFEGDFAVNIHNNVAALLAVMSVIH